MAGENNISKFTSAAPIIGAGLDFLSGVGSSLFNLNQARKNRAFQERMYDKQVEDNIRLWNMNNQWNLPSAVRQRMEDANLNPLLMYEGGSAMTVANTAAGGNAPSGDSARGTMQSNFLQGATQAALIQAQIDNIRADTENKLQQADESWTHTDWYRSTKGIQYGIMKKNNDLISYEINKIATETNSLADLTWKNLEVMDKGIEMLDKNYELSSRDLENRIAFNIATIALGNRQVDATLKDISVKLYDAVTKRMVSLKQIEVMTSEIKKIVADTKLSEAEREAKVNEIIHGKMSNLVFGHFGVKDLSGMTGAMLLLSTSLFPDGREEDFEQVKKMYKQYGIDF